MVKRVLVSGCFDMLHSGHVEFFRAAASYGELYVAVGSDKTIYNLKGRGTINSEQERLFMIRSIGVVKDAFISRGSGILDFEPEIREIKPDILIVNSDGDIPEKRQLCQELSISYLVLERQPPVGIEPRSTTQLRQRSYLPYRIDLAGGWLDQPFVSQHFPGSVVTISLEPTIDFNSRSGMATSTRFRAQELWGNKIPTGDYEQLAKILFCYDNPPGTKVISGSQDAIGLVFPGLAKAHYVGEYWPEDIEHTCNESLLRFVEESIYLVPLGPRVEDYDVLSGTDFSLVKAKALADAADRCWDAVHAQDINAFGKSIRAGFEAQIAMFPNMMNDQVQQLINEHQSHSLGWKLSGAGGGGYLILISDNPIAGALKVSARRACY